MNRLDAAVVQLGKCLSVGKRHLVGLHWGRSEYLYVVFTVAKCKKSELPGQRSIFSQFSDPISRRVGGSNLLSKRLLGVLDSRDCNWLRLSDQCA